MSSENTKFNKIECYDFNPTIITIILMNLWVVARNKLGKNSLSPIFPLPFNFGKFMNKGH